MFCSVSRHIKLFTGLLVIALCVVKFPVVQFTGWAKLIRANFHVAYMCVYAFVKIKIGIVSLVALCTASKTGPLILI